MLRQLSTINCQRPYFSRGLAHLRLAQTPNPNRMVLPTTGRASVSQGTGVAGVRVLETISLSPIPKFVTVLPTGR